MVPRRHADRLARGRHSWPEGISPCGCRAEGGTRVAMGRECRPGAMSNSFNTQLLLRRNMHAMNHATTTATTPSMPATPSPAVHPAPARRLQPGGPSSRWWGLPLLWEMRADYLGFVTRLQRDHGDLTRMRLGNEDAWDLLSPDLVREALGTHADHLIRWERGLAVFEQVMTDAARSALDAAVPAGQSEALVAMDTLWTDVAMDVILRTLFSESAQADARDAA